MSVTTRDLATANHTASSASVLFGSGDGTFQSAMSYAIAVTHPTTLGVRPTSITSGDLDGDGGAALVGSLWHPTRNDVG